MKVQVPESLSSSSNDSFEDEDESEIELQSSLDMTQTSQRSQRVLGGPAGTDNQQESRVNNFPDILNKLAKLFRYFLRASIFGKIVFTVIAVLTVLFDYFDASNWPMIVTAGFMWMSTVINFKLRTRFASNMRLDIEQGEEGMPRFNWELELMLYFLLKMFLIILIMIFLNLTSLSGVDVLIKMTAALTLAIYIFVYGIIVNIIIYLYQRSGNDLMKFWISVQNFVQTI